MNLMKSITLYPSSEIRVFAWGSLFYFGGEKESVVVISVILTIVEKLYQKMKPCNEI